jgi:hypothetical protein
MSNAPHRRVVLGVILQTLLLLILARIVKLFAIHQPVFRTMLFAVLCVKRQYVLGNVLNQIADIQFAKKYVNVLLVSFLAL